MAGGLKVSLLSKYRLTRRVRLGLSDASSTRLTPNLSQPRPKSDNFHYFGAYRLKHAESVRLSLSE